MSYSTDNINDARELDWDDPITNDESEYQPLPEGGSR